MARISLDPPRTLSYRVAARFSRRRYGAVLDPVAAVAHNARVGLAYGLRAQTPKDGRASLRIGNWHVTVTVPLPLMGGADDG